MKNKLMLTALLGLLLVGSFSYAEESDDEAKKRLLKEYEKVSAENLLKDIPVAKVRTFQKEYVGLLKTAHPEVMSALKAGKIDKDLTDVLKQVALDLVAKYNN